ncbi:DNA topoisomerase 3 [Aliarcobacter cryaerophilus]|uniref:DNA topoisomerase n=1 Tax=Aliarcobacter cryaerophilus TaxID=28198 RepID=A0AA46N393_9BACT|nr:DNA topoisomerase 3 [Aliarcobacter cryaerophilus]UYF42543.1 DNA topoisomerase 3 [Aliarcobacter cryaerophilus]
MRLFIAEKPELAKAITTGLSGTLQREDGFFKVGDNLVTWAYGHILGLAMPESYDERFKSWNLEDLPLPIGVNGEYSFRYVPLESSKKQLKIIIDLINSKDVTKIVNAGDNDEEGQILVDEILMYADNKKPVERVLISDLTEKGVKKALQEIKSNDEFKGLSDSGFSRSQADWQVGLNFTRAYTKLAQAQVYQGVLSVGRVQTPILGLIVARDKENESHQSSFYYTVKGSFNSDNIIFNANLKIDERITNEDEANKVLNDCKDNTGVILKAINEPKRTNPPLPYNLLDLQAECSKKYSYKPDKTLEITQSLREKHKLITYNRSDCSYLPENLFSEAPATLESIKANLLDFEDFIDQANSSIKSLAWNDENVTAHHGIIPTAQKVNIKDLSKDELNVYTLIARKFVAQFYEPKEYIHTQIEISIKDNIFATSSKRTIKQGFEVLFKGEIEDDETDDDSNDVNLENISQNSSAICNDVNISKEKTKPKPYYTIPSLLKDLTSVAKYIKDPEIKKLLIEKDKDKKGENGGIGTPATRSAHIKNLFDKGYIVEDKKAIKSTSTGKKLIELSPSTLTSPDMTALWFEQQKEIQNGNLTKDEFLNSVNDYIKKEIESLKEGNKFDSIAIDENAIKCPNCEAGTLKRIKNKDNKFFWGCSNYQGGCKTAFPDDKGKPLIIKPSGHKCPDCKDGDLIRRKTVKDKKTSYWWGCSNYSKGCKYTAFDEKGKPKKK